MNTPESESSPPEPSGLQVELGAKPARRFRAVWLVPLLLFLAVVTGATIIGRSRSSLPAPTASPATLEQSSSKQPTIAWSPGTLDLILSPGENASRSITFTSSTDLTNVVLEAVPTIAPFVTIKPNTISRVRANRPEKVQISFSIPITTTLGNYPGTIHLRLGSQTLPQTLKLNIDVWQPFVNQSIGIVFKLPPGFSANNPNPHIGQTINIGNFETTEPGGFDIALPCTVLFSVKTNPAELPLSEWIGENIRSDGVDSPVSFGGITGVRKAYIDEITSEDAVLVLLPKTGRVYTFSAAGTICISTLNHILSTVVLL